MRGRSYQSVQALSAAFLLIASVIAGVGIAAAPASTNTTHIESCTTITQPGKYVLTNDIINSQESTCIEINSDDVVLDGNGHRIDGVDAEPSTGILSEPTSDAELSNVVIHDVVVTDWATGIRFSMEVENSTVKNNVVRSNLANGIALFFNSVDNKIVRNKAINNGDAGIWIDNAARNRLIDNTVSQNRFGILVTESGSHVLRNNTAKRNTGDAIALLDFVSGTLVVNNTATHNGGDGVSVVSSSNNRIVHNTITRNDGNGIMLGEQFEDLTENNTVSRNTVKRNGDDGIVIEATNGNELVRNTIKRNSGDGIDLRFARANSIQRNTITHNHQDGILIGNNSTKTTVRRNTVTRNGDDGITLRQATATTLKKNTANNNRDDGVVLCNADENELVRNTANNNGDNGFVLIDSSNNTLRRNTALNNGGASLVVRGDSTGNQFIDNNFPGH